MSDTLDIGDTVTIPWGLDQVRGTVAEMYRNAGARRVVVALNPELSSHVVDEPTTVTLPEEAARRAVAA